MKPFAEFPAITILTAKKAFVLALAQHGASVPMSEVTTDTVTKGEGGNDSHIEVVWRKSESLLASAVGRFYPDSTSSGGVIQLDHLQPDTVPIQPEARKYVFKVIENRCLQLTVAP